MILSCPACSTRYSVPEAALGGGRTVRCAQCAHSWRAMPENMPVQEAAPAPNPAPHRTYRAKVETRKRQRRRNMALGGWGAVAATLVIGVCMSWVLRTEIVSAMPRTASAYAMAGADVNMYGLAIENMVSERVMDGGEPALSVRAELRNTDRRARTAPLVRFDLRDAEGEPFFAWTIAPETAQIAPGQTIPVAAILVNPPERAADVVMTLTTEPVTPEGAEIEIPTAAEAEADAPAPETHS